MARSSRPFPPPSIGDVPTIAFLAHVDTTPAFPASKVRPIVHRNYQGGDIVLSEQPPVVILADETPYLATQIGNDIVTSSGDTLLGADDKAGVAIVMTMAKHLLAGSLDSAWHDSGLLHTG